jgi:hypothetical protein
VGPSGVLAGPGSPVWWVARRSPECVIERRSSRSNTPSEDAAAAGQATHPDAVVRPGPQRGLLRLPFELVERDAQQKKPVPRFAGALPGDPESRGLPLERMRPRHRWYPRLESRPAPSRTPAPSKDRNSGLPRRRRRARRWDYEVLVLLLAHDVKQLGGKPLDLRCRQHRARTGAGDLVAQQQRLELPASSGRNSPPYRRV